MAPHSGNVLHQSRGDGDSDSIFNHPVVMFLSLFLLCFCTMAPVFWMLWTSRNDNIENVMFEEHLSRIRNWKRVGVVVRQQQQQQQQTTQQPIVQDVEQTVADNIGENRLFNVFPRLHKATISIYKAVASLSQMLREKFSQRFISITRAAPWRNRSQSRAGVSIDLPIMRQPAWQKLASGSVEITPSTTVVDFSKPTSAEIDLADMVRPSGHGLSCDNGVLMEEGLQAQHGLSDGAGGAELGQPQNETMVGLAIG